MVDTNQRTAFTAKGSEKKQAAGRGLALFAICTGYFMVILDATIVNVALPDIQHQLATSISGLQWVVDSYSLAFASLLLTAGGLGDHLGNRRMFLCGLALFTITSALCGAAMSIWMLLAARVFQGIGAALLVPTSLSLLSQLFPDTHERARAIGVWGAIAGIGAASGPVIGGLLINIFSRRAIFLVNLPVGILGFVLTWLCISTQDRPSHHNLDSIAQLISSVALGTLTLVIIEREHLGRLLILLLLLVAALAIYGFICIEQHVKQPMLPLTLFTNTTFSASNGVGLLLNLGFYGQLFVVSLFFQQLHRFSPLLTGLALLPESFMVFAGPLLSGRAASRFGARFPMTIGLALGSVGFAVMALITVNTSYILICMLFAAIGFGTSFTMPAMTAAVMKAAPLKYAGIASGALNASRQIGGALGVAIMGSLVGQHSNFSSGMHYSMLIASAAFFLGCLLTLFLVHE